MRFMQMSASDWPWASGKTVPVDVSSMIEGRNQGSEHTMLLQYTFKPQNVDYRAEAQCIIEPTGSVIVKHPSKATGDGKEQGIDDRSDTEDEWLMPKKKPRQSKDYLSFHGHKRHSKPEQCMLIYEGGSFRLMHLNSLVNDLRDARSKGEGGAAQSAPQVLQTKTVVKNKLQKLMRRKQKGKGGKGAKKGASSAKEEKEGEGAKAEGKEDVEHGEDAEQDQEEEEAILTGGNYGKEERERDGEKPEGELQDDDYEHEEEEEDNSVDDDDVDESGGMDGDDGEVDLTSPSPLAPREGLLGSGMAVGLLKPPTSVAGSSEKHAGGKRFLMPPGAKK